MSALATLRKIGKSLTKTESRIATRSYTPPLELALATQTVCGLMSEVERKEQVREREELEGKVEELIEVWEECEMEGAGAGGVKGGVEELGEDGEAVEGKRKEKKMEPPVLDEIASANEVGIVAAAAVADEEEN